MARPNATTVQDVLHGEVDIDALSTTRNLDAVAKR